MAVSPSGILPSILAGAANNIGRRIRQRKVERTPTQDTHRVPAETPEDR